MGVKFGNLAKLRGITYFRLSPYEQNPFAGAVANGGSLLSRGLHNLITIGPIFLMTYAIMQWATEENRRIHRKNPKDYENDT